MPVPAIREYMNTADIMGQLDMLLALHCAPMVCGLKLSNLIMLNRSQSIVLKDMLLGSDITFWVFYSDGDQNQTLLYRQKDLQGFLDQTRIQRILRQFHYVDFEVVHVLRKLTEHMQAFFAGRRDFPHELGLILGYPVKDVLGFVEHDGEHYSACGYWKVYGDAESARRVFEVYDRVREAAVVQVLSGYGFLWKVKKKNDTCK